MRRTAKSEITTYEDFVQANLDFHNDADLISELTVTESRIEGRLDELAKALSFFYSYPDVFADLMVPGDSDFKLFFFQRLFLRATTRYRQVFETATRGASKSFIGFLSRYITCMFVPRHQSFVTTEIKEQAANIAQQKINQDLWVKFPLLTNEMVSWRDEGGSVRKAFTGGKGYASYRFTSGSTFDVVGVDSARGLRRHSGIFEEVILLDPIPINESIIPLMNIPRLTAQGRILEDEQANGQKIFITSAGYQGTFAYDKMLETLVKSAVYPEDYICLTIDYRIPMYHNLIAPKLITEIKSSPSFSKDSFEREYFSKWSGEVKGAAFSYASIMRSRKVKFADYQNKAKETEFGSEFYVVSADMAKDGAASTAVTITKVRPGRYSYNYLLVNGFEISTTDYEEVARRLKETALQYEAKLLVYDASGIGASIRDWLNKPSSPSGQSGPLPGFGIINPPTSAERDLIKYQENNICYEIKATGQSASDINQFFFSRVGSGSWRMLIPFREAVKRYEKNKSFVYAKQADQQRVMAPYQACDRLQQELLNLDIKEVTSGTGSALRVTRRDTKIQKDFFSSAEYGMYAAHVHFELPYYKKLVRRERGFDISAYYGVNEV